MNILSLFVLIPVLMLIAFIPCKNIKQVRTVAVLGTAIELIFSVVFLFMFLSGKDMSCSYFPNARVLKDIRNKPFHYSDESKAQLNQKAFSDFHILISENAKKNCHIRFLQYSSFLIFLFTSYVKIPVPHSQLNGSVRRSFHSYHCSLFRFFYLLQCF